MNRIVLVVLFASTDDCARGTTNSTRCDLRYAAGDHAPDYHTGNDKERFSLDRVVVKLPWAGNPSKRIDDTNRGSIFRPSTAMSRAVFPWFTDLRRVETTVSAEDEPRSRELPSAARPH
jgi:hypothetical protein